MASHVTGLEFEFDPELSVFFHYTMRDIPRLFYGSDFFPVGTV